MKSPIKSSWIGLFALWLAPAWAQPGPDAGPPDLPPAVVASPIGLGNPGKVVAGPGAAAPSGANSAPVAKNAGCLKDCPQSPGALNAPPERDPKCQPPAALVHEVRIGLQDGEVVGGCDEKIVGRMIRKRANALRYCAQRLRAQNLAVAPEVTLTWLIGPQGTVESSKAVAKGEGPEALARCLEAQARRWRYEGPPPAGVCTARWTLTYEAHDACRGKVPGSTEVPLGGFR